MNFIPTPSIFNKNLWNKKLDDFFRLIKQETYFKENNVYNPTTENQHFKPKTNGTRRPGKNPLTIEAYLKATNHALQTEEKNNNEKKYYKNATKTEQRA